MKRLSPGRNRPPLGTSSPRPGGLRPMSPEQLRWEEHVALKRWLHAQRAAEAGVDSPEGPSDPEATK